MYPTSKLILITFKIKACKTVQCIIINFAEKRREIFFEETLTGLHRVAHEGYPALKGHCRNTLTSIDRADPALPAFVDISALQTLEQDSYTKTLVPSDVPESLVPLKCSGDGNCLFRYIYWRK